MYEVGCNVKLGCLPVYTISSSDGPLNECIFFYVFLLSHGFGVEHGNMEAQIRGWVGGDGPSIGLNVEVRYPLQAVRKPRSDRRSPGALIPVLQWGVPETTGNTSCGGCVTAS